MYEDQTYEAILERMLGRVPDGLDKREGSIIFDALAPAAAELAQAYIELSSSMNFKFAATASGEFLDRSIAWSGLTRKQATKARLRGRFIGEQNLPAEVPIGSRFSLDALNYTVIDRLDAGEYMLECETVGKEGNRRFGTLLPLEYIEGLVKAELLELLAPGEDTESDEALYDRYREKISRPVTSANRNQYELWAREQAGVGKAKAFPLWDGPGTVKVVLLDNEMRSPAPSIVEAVQQYIDPTMDGMGEGAAPVGSVVTVTGAVEVPVNIEVQVTLLDGAGLDGVQQAIEQGVRQYLKDLAMTDPLVRYNRIANVILDIPEVIDYEVLTVNGGTESVLIEPEAVAVLGTVTVR
ncbi:baseplate J/gp47 family protein [Paenibacillus sp. FSL K6-1566]|uniref:Phage protein gp47/JayE n=1 Tax=Paenibacillus lactis TaxID=228574 RepID=A0ABS4F8C7_9BACL|nr:baseplate J/gp47 family protein [Paenibacillus lactis]MBP1892506.1 putative phage protein gp47/JayE [Paenibacillus lactis]MCM3493247.1 baseplate J/gp47 family protein [Paenibacillus lactis]HAF97069.1 baseplate J protein [Paenibacillus lactis]